MHAYGWNIYELCHILNQIEDGLALSKKVILD